MTTNITQQPTKSTASWHFVVKSWVQSFVLVRWGAVDTHTRNVCHVVVVVVAIQEKSARLVGWVVGGERKERVREREPFFIVPCGNECIQKE